MSSPTPPPLGLCCYALAWSCGFAGDGTPRACPEPLDAGGLLDLALSHGLGRLELPRSMVPDDASRAAFRERAGAACLSSMTCSIAAEQSPMLVRI